VNDGVRILDAGAPRSLMDDALASRVAGGLGLAVRIVREPLDLDGAYDASRSQYDATALLGQVRARARAAGERCVAVVSVDLFIPVLTYVFGQAMLGGEAGIVSIRRLDEAFYGMAADPARLRERLEKELLHEIGHQLGLYHCHQFECVMRSSTEVEEIDLKRAWFCEACAGKLRELQPGVRPPA
jgi:archaemetzincin